MPTPHDHYIAWPHPSPAASTEPPSRFVTVNLSCDLLGTAQLGEWVDLVVSPSKVGRRLAAGTARLTTDRVIGTVTALFVPV